jgi:hypothetical protein
VIGMAVTRTGIPGREQRRVRISRCEGAAFHQDRQSTFPEDVPGIDLVRSLEFRQP